MKKSSSGSVAAITLVCLLSICAFSQSGSLTGAGSTFVNPLMSKWSKEYHTLHPNVQINYQSIGSGGGRQQFLAKTVAFGASDAPLTDEQLTQAGEKSSDLVIMATGVKPASELARDCGIRTGLKDAIVVDRFMRTNFPNVYAAGDCVETWHNLLQEYKYLPLGTTSHKQGRVAGENAVGGAKQFAGSLGTQVVKVFDLAAGRTGLRDHEAKLAGFNPRTIETTAWDHKAYYPRAQQMTLRVTGDTSTGKLLGAQIVGHWRSEVAKRIDVFATALYHGMTVDSLNDLDLSYTPPLSSPWDPVQLAAQKWSRGPAASA